MRMKYNKEYILLTVDLIVMYRGVLVLQSVVVVVLVVPEAERVAADEGLNPG